MYIGWSIWSQLSLEIEVAQCNDMIIRTINLIEGHH